MENEKALLELVDCSPRDIARCITHRVKGFLPRDVVESYSVLPLRLKKEKNKNEILEVLSAQPLEYEVVKTLSALSGYPILVSIHPDREKLKETISCAYLSDSTKLKESVERARLKKEDNHEIKSVPLTAEDPVLDLLQKLLEYAVRVEASDLHLCPRIDGVWARLRIHGELKTSGEAFIDHLQYGQIVRKLKILSGANPTLNEPQDGSFDVPGLMKRHRVRFSSLPTLHGEKISLRFFGGFEERNFSELGLPLQAESALLGALSYREGLVCISGATGSGKTTTLYALLDHVARKGNHLITVEDPIEKELAFATQVQVNVERGLTFEKALKTILRHDPDVLLIGEVRDKETARIAVEAATTGHLVLCSLHASSTHHVMQRFEQLGVKNDDFCNAAKLIAFQRLSQKMCDYCSVLDLQASGPIRKVSKTVGCARCDYSGYSGRELSLSIASVSPEGGTIIFSNLSETNGEDIFFTT